MANQRLTFDLSDEMANEIQILALASRQSQRQIIVQLLQAALGNLELDPHVARAVKLLRSNPLYVEQARKNSRLNGKGIQVVETQ